MREQLSRIAAVVTKELLEHPVIVDILTCGLSSINAKNSTMCIHNIVLGHPFNFALYPGLVSAVVDTFCGDGVGRRLR